VPPTPSKSTAGEGPVPPRPPRSSTETRHHPLLAHGKPDDLLSPHPRTPSSTSLQAIGTSAKRQGSPLQSLRQKVISPIKPSFASPSKRAASARLVDSLLADANNIRSAFLRDAQQKREERRYRIDAIENEDEPEEDLEDALDSLR